MAYRLEDQDAPTREALAALGSAMLEIRKARGLTQRQLSSRSGLAQSTISRLETGKAPWLAAVWIARLLAALDLEPGLMGFGATAVKSSVPGWVILMRRFEANRRYRELQTIAERDRQLRDERMARLRKAFEREGPLTPDELRGIRPRPVLRRSRSRHSPR
jgi:transcriptional regulator with XRE-family HTH domain